MKQLDRWLIAEHQLDALRADGRGSGVFLEILKFLGVMVLAMIGELVLQIVLGACTGMAYVLLMGETDPNVIAGMLPGWLGIALNLFSNFGMIGVTLLLLRFACKRKLATAGLTKPFWSEYGLGLLAGFAAFGAAAAICVVTGTVRIEGISPGFAVGPFLLLFAGFLVQGMSEELLCRGYFMLSVARKNSAAAGILCNSLVFAALHLANNGIAPLALVNLFLFGVFASLYYLWRGNLWGIAAFHSMWNFTQGNIFGILVSGGDMGTSLLTSTPSASGTVLNGGDFGLEGGLAVTIVLVIGIVCVFLRNQKRIAGAAAPALPHDPGR